MIAIVISDKAKRALEAFATNGRIAGGTLLPSGNWLIDVDSDVWSRLAELVESHFHVRGEFACDAFSDAIVALTLPRQ